MRTETLERRITSNLEEMVAVLQDMQRTATAEGISPCLVYSNETTLVLERERLTDGSFVLNLIVRSKEA